MRWFIVGLVLLTGWGWAEELTSASPARIRAARATPVGRTVLPNGLVLLVREAPQEDLVAVELLVKVGLVDEKGPVSGVTALVLKILEERIEENELLAFSGSDLKVSTEPDYARLSLLTTTEEFPILLRSVSEAMKKTQFDEDRVAKLSKKMVDGLGNPGNAFTQLYSIFRNSFYRYHPYRKSDRGSKLSLQRLTPERLTEFYSTYFVPNRMVLSVSGRIDRLKVVDRVRQEFGDLLPGEGQVLEIPWEPKASEKQVHLSASADIAWLFIGFPAPSVASRDYLPMALIHSILGDGLSSRLFTEIREKRGLAYEVGATYPILQGPSHLLTYVITRPNEVGKTRRTLLEQVERLKTEPISPLELEGAKRKVRGRYWLARETNRERALTVAVAETIGLGYQFDQNFLQELERVTPQDIQRVASAYLVNPTLVVARPGGRFYLDL